MLIIHYKNLIINFVIIMVTAYFVTIISVDFSDSYFIQKGANVNTLGGELQSAPIHWATRYNELLLFSTCVIMHSYIVDRVI